MVDEEEELDEEDDDDDYEGLTPAFYFVDDIFVKIANKEKKKGKQSLTEEQLALLTAWHVFGLVENGALFYFFEHRLDVNEVARAYETVGMPERAVILKQAVALFPNSKPPEDFDELLNLMADHEEALTSLSTRFVRGQKNVVAMLGDYIRKHEAAFKEFMK
jgi:hypothetical protein